MTVRAQQNHTTWTAILDATSGEVLRGRVLVLNASAEAYLPSTAANRASVSRRSAGIALTAADGVTVRTVEFQFVGIIPASISELGAGAADEDIRVSSDGWLERVSSPTEDDELVGSCDADGTAYVVFTGRRGPPGANATPGGSVGSVQAHGAGGTFAGSESWNVSTDGDGALVLGPEADAADDGDVRIPGGYDDAANAESFSIQQLNYARNGNQTLLAADNEARCFFGAGPVAKFNPAHADEAYWESYIGARQYIGLSLLDPDAVITTVTPSPTVIRPNVDLRSDIVDAVSGGIYAGKNVGLFEISSHCNLSLNAGRLHTPSAADMGYGRGVFFIGKANQAPTNDPSSTGIVLYSDPTTGYLSYRIGPTTITLDGSGGFDLTEDGVVGASIIKSTDSDGAVIKRLVDTLNIEIGIDDDDYLQFKARKRGVTVFSSNTGGLVTVSQDEADKVMVSVTASGTSLVRVPRPEDDDGAYEMVIENRSDSIFQIECHDGSSGGTDIVTLNPFDYAEAWLFGGTDGDPELAPDKQYRTKLIVRNGGVYATPGFTRDEPL